jgi:small-conductance mechanosensitive channel
MGVFIWHQWARYVSLTATVYTVWSGFWGLIFRKFFWDFVNGTVRNPGGIQPAKSDAIFITLIVKAPIIPILAIVFGLFMLALEYPLPQLKALAIHRSLVLRVVLLLFQAFLTILYYQGTNAAIYSITAAIGYARAIAIGEEMEVAKDNRGKGGRA